MTLEEFITDFKERVVEGVYWNLPKEYRKSNEYEKQELEEKYLESMRNWSFRDVLEEILSYYYEKINSYEEDD